MDYFIAIEIEATPSISEITKALRDAFAEGVPGDFTRLITHQPSHMFIVKRSRDDDYGELNDRMLKGSSMTNAAMQKLAAELAKSSAKSSIKPIIKVLKNGDAQCFDFEGFF